jgi:hypothetical protein
VTSHTAPAISVGSISSKNNNFKSGNYPPLYGLETPSFDFYVAVPDSSDDVGTLSLGAESSFDWYHEWLKSFRSNYRCEVIYNRDFDKYSTTSPNDPNGVEYAEKFKARGLRKYKTSPGACTIGKVAQTTRLTYNATHHALKMFDHLVLNKTICEELNSPLRELETNPATIIKQQSTKSSSKLLEYLSFATIMEQDATSYFNSLMTSVYYNNAVNNTDFLACTAAGNSSRACRKAESEGYACAWNIFNFPDPYGSCNWAPPDLKYSTQSALYTNIAKYHCDRAGNSKNTTAFLALGNALTDAMTSTSAGNYMERQVESFCEWFDNIDAVRSSRAEAVGTSRSSINKKLFNDWGGEYNSITDTHETKFTSFYFSTADDSTNKYDYTAYFNLSGLCGFTGGTEVLCYTTDVGDSNLANNEPTAGYVLDDPLTPMMLALQSRMNSAILSANTNSNYELEVDSKNFPTILNKCAYDPFNCLSIVDFIAAVFLPYIFLLYVYIIQGLIVSEKSSQLRDIMLMSGLKMRVYWAVLWVFYFVQYMVMILILWLAGYLTGLRTFTLHSPGVLIIFFILWGNCMIAFSFMVTTFFTNPRTATVVLLLLVVLSVQAGQTLLVQLVLNPTIGDDELAYLPCESSQTFRLITFSFFLKL